jgi:ketosteroid isomerase-like protein
MSQENVDVVRRAIDAFNRGDLDSAAAADFCDPDVEFHEDPDFPDGGVHRGTKAIEAHFQQFLDSFEDLRFEIEEVIDVGAQVVVNRQHARGHESGAKEEMRNAWVFEFRDEKIVRITPYWDRSQALEAAGLRE